MPTIPELLSDPDFKAASPGVRLQAFEHVASSDQDWIDSSPELKAQVRSSLISPGELAGPVAATAATRIPQIAEGQDLPPGMAPPASLLSRVGERLAGATVGPLASSVIAAMKGAETSPAPSSRLEAAKNIGMAGLSALNVPWGALSAGGGSAVEEEARLRGVPPIQAQAAGDIGEAATNTALAVSPLLGVLGRVLKGARAPGTPAAAPEAAPVAPAGVPAPGAPQATPAAPAAPPPNAPILATRMSKSSAEALARVLARGDKTGEWSYGVGEPVGAVGSRDRWPVIKWRPEVKVEPAAIEQPMAAVGGGQPEVGSSEAGKYLRKTSGAELPSSIATPAESGTLTQEAPSQRSNQPVTSSVTERIAPSPITTTGPPTTLKAPTEASIRPVLQPVNDMAANLAAAKEAQPGMIAELTKIAEENGGSFSSSRIKGQKGIDRKLLNRDPNQISDYVDVRLVAESPEAIPKMVDAIGKRFKVNGVKDTIEGGVGEGGYRAVHLDVRAPNGHSVEIQVVPREVMDFKKASGAYEDYKKWQARTAPGEPPLTPEEIVNHAADMKRSQAGFSDAYQQFADRAAPVKAEPAAAIRTAPAGGQDVVTTERGTQVPIRYRVAEASDLVASHDERFQPNPAYPAELQPRDRTRAASQLQVQKIAKNLEPRRLIDSSSGGAEGAPIVGPDQVVESGNARVMALRTAYKDYPANAQAYRDYIEQNAERLGVDPAEVRRMRQPVLVRERVGEVNRAQFAREANEGTVLGMGSTEKAMADAAQLTDKHMELLAPDELTAAGNRHFVRAFGEDIIGPSDRAQFFTSTGEVSQEGVRRMQNAVLAKAYGDPAALEKLTEATDSNIRNVGAGMLEAAGEHAKLRQGIESGDLQDVGIGEDISAAARKLSALRAEGTPVETYLQQQAMFGEDLTPFQKQLLAGISDNSRSSKRVATFLERYAQLAEDQAGAKQVRLFGEEPPTKGQLLAEAYKQTSEAVGGKQGGLFDASAATSATSTTSRFATGLREATPGAGETLPGPRPPGEGAGAPGEASAAREATPVAARAEALPKPEPLTTATAPKLVEAPRPEAPPAPAGEGPGLGEPLEVPQLREFVHRSVTQAAKELFAKGGVKLDPKKLISDQVVELLNAEKVSLPELAETLKKNNLTFTTFADQMFRPAIADAGRRLQALSVLKREINLLAKDPATSEELGRVLRLTSDIDASIPARSWWRRADNIRRGLLVTQLATATRNFTQQVGRVLLDGFDVAIQRAFQPAVKAFGGKIATENKLGALDGFESFLNIFKKGTKQQVARIFKQMPQLEDRLLGTYSSDVANMAARPGAGAILKGADKVFLGAEKAVGALNWANKLQEFVIRRGVFLTKLAQRARARGFDLAELIDKNQLGRLPESDFAASIDKALEMTYAKSPKYGTFAADFVRATRLPIVSFITPFGRFLYNSTKFLYEFSPVSLLKLASPAERAAIAAGNTQTLSRVTIGTALLGAAYQLRKSEFAGEKWNEIRVNGTTYDMRPYNPFAAYLFLGDVINRKLNGTLERLEGKDIADAVLSVNVKGGIGLGVLDQAIRGIGELSQTGKWKDAAKGAAGQLVAGLLTPLQTLTDVMAQFNPELAKGRQTREEPFLGPIKAKIPTSWGSESLPERQSPTREATPQRDQPLLRQLTGLTVVEPKNPAEKELDRLQFQPQEILPSSGEPAADRLIAKHMGPIVETLIGGFVSDPFYKDLPEQTKGLVLSKMLAAARQQAVKAAKDEDPALMEKVKLERLPSRLGAAIEETAPGTIPKR